MTFPQVSRDGDPLCLMTIHAHPDDEDSNGAPIVARYFEEGVRTVLVCCTGDQFLARR
jgi:mycothiol S-conjugate amidase